MRAAFAVLAMTVETIERNDRPVGGVHDYAVCQ
jgi:hypothetical protein